MHEQKKIALFVDFDNIYLGLRETSREAAEAFATRPASWLRWIEHGMPLDPRADRAGPRENRVLIRRCYLNPDTFGKYRGYFTRSGFSVVDCPPLTSRGKNSSDIVMVMDILDALRHETHFDRFVIMSADADFTPVLQRLRAYDRRTAVLVSGQAAPAYRAACDRLITEDQFIELALEMPAAAEPPRPVAPPPAAAPASAASNGAAAAPPAPGRDPELLASIGRRIYEEASSTGTLSASELPRILREFKEFTPTSNWLGFFSLQNLAEAVLAHRPELRITDDDPWRIAVQVADDPAPPAADETPSPAQPPAGEWDDVRARVIGRVSRMVAESAEPVVMGKAAHVAIQEAGPLITETRWLGRGTFKNLLNSVPGLPFQVVASPLPGYLYDPARHPDPRQRVPTDGLAEMEGEMASLVRRIHQLTDAPRLTPRQHRVLWQVIAKEITRAPYSLMSTGKAVRDQCVERGEPIARQSITTVLRALSYGGYRFWEPPHRPDTLASTYRGNLLNLLRQAQVTLSDDEMRLLDDWLMGAADEPPASPQSVSPAADASDADSPAEPAPVPVTDQQQPAEPVEPDFATADALPATEARDAASADPAPAVVDAVTAIPDDALPAAEAASPSVDTSSADAAPADAVAHEPGTVTVTAVSDEPASDSALFAAPKHDPELADALPAELSDDHGPAGPDEVAADWEMSPDSAPPPAYPAPPEAPAAPSPASETPSGEPVAAEWQPADAPSDAPEQPAPSPAPPGQPPAVSHAPAGEAVTPHFEVVAEDAAEPHDHQPPRQTPR